MNAISAFFVRNIVAVFFVYGLAFFSMGLALALTSRRASEFRFAQAIRPLALFGVLHGVHEWIEMFQKIGTLTSGYTPATLDEVVRLAVLVASFVMLLLFGILLLSSARIDRRQAYLASLGMTGLWGVSVLAAWLAFHPAPDEMIAQADVLARYGLGIPGGLLGTWALMTQQRTFREHGMPQFGRDLVWCATALLLYGVVGQIFVRQTTLIPSIIINSTLFLQWFGIPVQLFRGVLATVLAVYMVRALNAFELEGRRRLEEANQARLAAQAAALEAERRTSREMERLNQELRLTARELSLLLDLSNVLVVSMSLSERLHNALEHIVRSLDFPDAGMILLVRRETHNIQVRASTGFSADESDEKGEQYVAALDLGEQCVTSAVARGRCRDGQVVTLSSDEDDWQPQSTANPLLMVSLPLTARKRVIGGLVLGRSQAASVDKVLALGELKLMLGMAQQLGLSIENALLYQEAQERESTLAELLHQVVGAQETERQRIARELHDSTGQSLTGIALGLRGVEAILAGNPALAIEQIKELKSFSTHALGELRRIIADLRPSQLDDLGLVAALQWYFQDFERRSGIHIDFIVQGRSSSRLPAEYETVLFRIAQEALTNIIKHADASQVTVKFQIHAAQISLSIEDNGRGFNPAEVLRQDSPHGWGLLGIQERSLLLGGQYAIDSAPGRGTRIRVSIPLIVETKDVKNTIAAG
jgi:signal transduction histidine kinase